MLREWVVSGVIERGEWGMRAERVGCESEWGENGKATACFGILRFIKRRLSCNY